MRKEESRKLDETGGAEAVSRRDAATAPEHSIEEVDMPTMPRIHEVVELDFGTGFAGAVVALKGPLTDPLDGRPQSGALSFVKAVYDAVGGRLSFYTGGSFEEAAIRRRIPHSQGAADVKAEFMTAAQEPALALLRWSDYGGDSNHFRSATRHSTTEADKMVAVVSQFTHAQHALSAGYGAVIVALGPRTEHLEKFMDKLQPTLDADGGSGRLFLVRGVSALRVTGSSADTL